MAEKIGLAGYGFEKSDDGQVIWWSVAGDTRGELGYRVGALRQHM
jgi:hypothetical protein